MKRIILFGVLLIGIVSICWSVYRDIQIEKLYPGDLRNRIVGARLQKDGKMPYFYKWKPTDGLRYYNPQNFDTLKVSTSTASPFFHQLLYPIADMQQRTISRLWVFLQYVLLFAMTGIALTFTENLVQKIAVLTISISFLFTEAWIDLIATGQLYLFIPFLALACYFFLRRPASIGAALFAGLFAVSLVLIRPNTGLVFLPFIFIAGRYSLRYKITFFVPVILLLGYIVGNEHQRALWKEYGESLSEQIKLHQNLGPATQQNEKDPEFALWEGWNMAEIEAEAAKSSYVNYSENGNFFVLVRDLSGIHLSTTFLSIASFSLIFMLLLLFYFFCRKSGFHIYNLAILGFCLYMTSDLFSPVYRHQYYTVQWFFPLLLAAAGYVKDYKWIYAALALGIILNITNLSFIKMEHTIGEYIIFAALLLLAFVYNPRKQLNPHFYTQFFNEEVRYAIIIGAGPAGLTAAYELLTKTDILPIVIEQDKQPGGLSKTVDHHGNKIDIGGHRFFSKSEKVVNWWLHFLPLEPVNAGDNFHIRYRGDSASFHHAEATVTDKQQVMMLRPRKSRIYFKGQFFNYPIRLNGSTLLKLGLTKTLRIAFTYARTKLFPRKPERNLADFYRNRFGSELYHTFFEEYTRKVWGVPCEKLPATWGRQRVKDLSIGKVIRHAFKSVLGSNTTIRQEGTSTSLIEQFMYPRYGPGQMWETVAKAIEELGGKICYNTTVTAINAGANGCIQSAEVTNNTTGAKKIHEGEYFFSTMPVKELVTKLTHLPIPEKVRQAAESLEYRDFLIVGMLASGLAVKESHTAFTDNWIYIQDRNIKAGRIQFFHNWSPYMVKDPGDIWIGVEYFCNEADVFWQQDDAAIAGEAVREMEDIGILHAQQVKDKLVVRVKKAYPSYFGGYENFGVVQEFLDRIDNLYLVGRNGMHRYNNSDHSMLTAMAAVENIITGRKDKTNIWEINTEEAYHEEKNAGPAE